MVREDAAAVAQPSFQMLDRVERLVGECLVAERPQMLGRLHLGRVGWLELEDDAVGDLEVGAGMPAGTVEGEQDDLCRPLRSALQRRRPAPR